jgi:hypothetical protein
MILMWATSISRAIGRGWPIYLRIQRPKIMYPTDPDLAPEHCLGLFYPRSFKGQSLKNPTAQYLMRVKDGVASGPYEPAEFIEGP